MDGDQSNDNNPADATMVLADEVGETLTDGGSNHDDPYNFAAALGLRKNLAASFDKHVAAGGAEGEQDDQAEPAEPAAESAAAQRRGKARVFPQARRGAVPHPPARGRRPGGADQGRLAQEGCLARAWDGCLGCRALGSCRPVGVYGDCQLSQAPLRRRQEGPGGRQKRRRRRRC